MKFLCFSFISVILLSCANANEERIDRDVISTTAMAEKKIEEDSHNARETVHEALQLYFDALQVILGFVPAPRETSKFKKVMEPLVKEVQWSLGVMHPGMDETLVTDEVIMKHLNVVGESHKTKQKKDDGRRLADSDICLQQTRDILAMGMRIAYYGLYGDLQSDVQIQDAGRNVADQLDVVEVRERLRHLGPLRKSENDYKLIAKEVFKSAEKEIGLNGILNNGMKEWDMNNFWATGFFASQMWASAVQVGVYDTFPISSQTFSNPDLESTDTISNEFAALIDNYNTQCPTCPSGWTDNGLSTHGLHCTTGWSPNCNESCLQTECGAAKGKWENIDSQVNPFTCYMKSCPMGWNNLGIHHDSGVMCTMSRRGNTCDEVCAQSQCNNVGGSFPLSMDNVADNPFVCFV